MDPGWLKPLLEALANSLGNLPYACDEAKVSLPVVERACEEHPSIKVRIDTAAEIRRGRLLAHATKWATTGIKVAVYNKTGNCIGYRHDLSERMAELLLATFMPKARPVPVPQAVDESSEPPESLETPARQ